MPTMGTKLTSTMASYAEYLAEDRRPLVNAFYALPIPLEIASTLYRLWVKTSRRSEGALGYDDFLIVWATVAGVAECVAGLVYGAPHGLGRHVETLKPEDVSTYLQGDYIFSHFYDFAIVSTKLSVLALYYRIFITTQTRIVISFTFALVFAWLVAMEVVLGLGCQPIQGWWDASQAATAKCVDKVAFTYSTNILNLVFDLWIFSMPIPLILGLNMHKGRRVALCVLFSIGLGVCAISIARLSVVFSAASDDVTWQEVPLGILSAWEPCGAILCANLPVIYRTLHEKASRMKASLQSSIAARDTVDFPPIRREDSGTIDWIRLDGGDNECDNRTLTGSTSNLNYKA
ncbi:hypothetical protein F5Y18DRAFT_405736 [Xylariaceae sp. FL1019]|nr:hypothetical protein F5Y18DRAFT_405736 [Xylariaceae sp. FL1019]